jgi:hypothetical protein
MLLRWTGDADVVACYSGGETCFSLLHLRQIMNCAVVPSEQALRAKIRSRLLQTRTVSWDSLLVCRTSAQRALAVSTHRRMIGDFKV